MGYRWNKLAPFYLEFTDYNLKNVYSVVKIKRFGKKRYRIYDKHLIEGLYKFGFYKDIINGELAVIDAGIKRIQIMKDEISGKDFDINLSWVFATKHLETQNSVHGYEYKSLYNLKLLCLSLSRLENKNKCLRNKVRLFNLKPSCSLGFAKKGLFFSRLVFNKRNSLRSLLKQLLRFWYSKKLSSRGLRLWSFFLRKIRVRLRNLTILSLYYKLSYVKLFEILFWPVKAFSRKKAWKLALGLKRPPRWMLKRFGVKTHKKWVKRLFFASYVNLACGLWGSPLWMSRWRGENLKRFYLSMEDNKLKRNDVLHLRPMHFYVAFSRFFNLLPRVKKALKKRKQRRKQRRKFLKFFLKLNIMFFSNTSSCYRFFFIQSLFNAIFSSNVSKKLLTYQHFLYFVCLFSQIRRNLPKFKKVLAFFPRHVLFLQLMSLPNRFCELFLYKERFFVYHIGSHYEVKSLNAFTVPLFHSTMRKFVSWIDYGSKKFLWKMSKTLWWFNKRYSWDLRKDQIMNDFLRSCRRWNRKSKKVLKRYRIYYKWLREIRIQRRLYGKNFWRSFDKTKRKNLKSAIFGPKKKVFKGFVLKPKLGSKKTSKIASVNRLSLIDKRRVLNKYVSKLVKTLGPLSKKSVTTAFDRKYKPKMSVSPHTKNKKTDAAIR